MADENDYKEIAPLVHYGVSKKYGRHIGIGSEGPKIHIYPQFIHIGGADEKERIALTTRQVRLVSKIIEKMGGTEPESWRGPPNAS